VLPDRRRSGHAHRVHETADVAAYLDSNPVVAGHTLVAPEPHVVPAEPALSEAVFAGVRTVVLAVDAVLGLGATTIGHTSGPFVGTIEHAHVHLLPRTPDDTVRIALPRRGLDPERGGLADRLRSAV